MEEEEGAEPGAQLSGTSCALSLQYEVWETASEFYIRNLFWNTEYCISVEPDVASRHIPAMRTAEQCVTIGHRDGKDGVGLWGALWDLVSLQPWEELRLLQGLHTTCAAGSALPTHLGMSSLAESAELIPITVSSFAIVLFLLGILGALLVCTYLKKPMRPPSVLVRQRAHRVLCGCCRGWERQATSVDEAGLTPLFSVPPRSHS